MHEKDNIAAEEEKMFIPLNCFTRNLDCEAHTVQ